MSKNNLYLPCLLKIFNLKFYCFYKKTLFKDIENAIVKLCWHTILLIFNFILPFFFIYAWLKTFYWVSVVRLPATLYRSFGFFVAFTGQTQRQTEQTATASSTTHWVTWGPGDLGILGSRCLGFHINADTHRLLRSDLAAFKYELRCCPRLN